MGHMSGCPVIIPCKECPGKSSGANAGAGMACFRVFCISAVVGAVLVCLWCVLYWGHHGGMAGAQAVEGTLLGGVQLGLVWLGALGSVRQSTQQSTRPGFLYPAPILTIKVGVCGCIHWCVPAPLTLESIPAAPLGLLYTLGFFNPWLFFCLLGSWDGMVPTRVLDGTPICTSCTLTNLSNPRECSMGSLVFGRHSGANFFKL